MPTKKQLSKMWETEFEFPATRKHDDPAFTLNPENNPKIYSTMNPILASKANEIAVKYNNWVEQSYLKGEETGLWFSYDYYAEKLPQNGITDDELYSLWLATPEAAAILSGEDWISVEKEKPGHNQIVDAYDGKNRRCQYDAETKQFYRHTDFCDGDRLMRPYYPNVTHWKWIDFPEPPKP